MRHFLATIALLCTLAATLPARAADPQPNLRRTSTVEVVERTKDAVVYISSRKLVTQRLVDPIWQQFDMGTRTGLIGSLGSGFIVHPDGYIVTNNHVIDRARQIQVTLADGRQFDAELISADSEADLAILRIRGDKPFPTLELGDSSDLMIGEPVIAVGNPLGLSHSVSTGIVSAVHRDLKSQDDHINFGDLIQTDAAINLGNSGGPLINAYGQVIGINTIVRSDAQNIGFAIQINRLRDLIPELMSPAQVTKLDIPLKMKEQRQLTPPSNVHATILRQDGDVPIVKLGGHVPTDIVDAYAILLNQKANEPLSVELKGQPAMTITPKPVPPSDALVQAKTKLGLAVDPVTPMLAEKYHLLTEDGLYVTEVARDSVAAKAGIQPGDVIVQLGPYRVSTLGDLGTLLQYLPKSGIVPIGISRGNQAGRLRLQF